MNDEAFWIDATVRVDYIDLGCVITVTEPEFIAGWFVEPSDLDRCDGEHPRLDAGCPLVRGHEGPHWVAHRELLNHPDFNTIALRPPGIDRQLGWASRLGPVYDPPTVRRG